MLQDSDAEARGKVYVLDMGNPVRIIDLAHQMIRLAGLQPGKDIGIDIIGLRDGEKLHEELFDSDEVISATAHDSIQLASSPAIAGELIRDQIERLGEVAMNHQYEEMLNLISTLVPGFRAPEAMSKNADPIAPVGSE